MKTAVLEMWGGVWGGLWGSREKVVLVSVMVDATGGGRLAERIQRQPKRRYQDTLSKARAPTVGVVSRAVISKQVATSKD